MRRKAKRHCSFILLLHVNDPIQKDSSPYSALKNYEQFCHSKTGREFLIYIGLVYRVRIINLGTIGGSPLADRL